MLKRAIYLFIYLSLESVLAPVYASNLSLELTSDIRGIDEILNNNIVPNTGGSDGNSEDEDKERKVYIRPTLRFGYRRQHLWSEKLTFSSSFVLSNVYGRVRYPEGAIFGGVNFTDPLRLTLSSWDFALEQSVEFAPNESWALGALVGVKRQFIKLDTFFGDWNLNDSLIANRVEGSVWVDRKFLSFRRARVRIQATKGRGNTRFSLALRQYF